MKRLIILALALGAGGCDAFGDAMTAHTDVVARAAGHELTIDDMVDLLAGNPRLPAQTEVVASVADLWVDYTILAELAAEDSTLANVDLSPLINPYMEQRSFMELREQVVTSDTVFTDEELRQMYEQNNPGLRVRARHILLEYPEGASEAERDSVRQLAEELRSRVAEGEDFAALAEEYSADPGSARRGGDLGWFGAGQMVRPFEEAAFALQPGEVSEVVETPFGLHIIRVEERESPSFDEMGPDFRQQAVARRQQESLDEYVSGLVDPAGLEVESGALDIARDLARRPSERLTRRASARELVSWNGGELTAGEYLTVIQRFPPQQRAGIATMGDQQVESMLETLATNELVLADAEARGIQVDEAERDSVTAVLREQFASLAQEAGLAGGAQEGESEREARERRVRTLLQGILSGQQSMLPLGGLPFSLRQEAEWQINERTFPVVVDRLEERRESQGSGPVPDLQMPQGQTPQPPAQDTAG